MRLPQALLRYAVLELSIFMRVRDASDKRRRGAGLFFVDDEEVVTSHVEIGSYLVPLSAIEQQEEG